MNPTVTSGLFGIYSLLIIITGAFFLARQKFGSTKLIQELIERTNSWWILVSVAAVALFVSDLLALISLALLSIFAFREIISHFDLQKKDKKVLYICYAAIPMQYYWAYTNQFEIFISFIPVLIFMLIVLRSVSIGKTEGISQLMNNLHWSMMMTVFTFSHLALFYFHHMPLVQPGAKYRLILYLVMSTELNDVFQFTWGKIFGKNKICPEISPKKTVEGFVGGVLSTILLSYFMRDFIMLSAHQAVILGFLISTTGFLGDITFSAMKRDLKIKDLGSLIPGHGGLLDRIDSLALTSIVFFYAMKFLN